MDDKELRRLAEFDHERRLNGKAATQVRTRVIAFLIAKYGDDQAALSRVMTEIDVQIAELRVEEKELSKLLDPPALYVGLTRGSRQRHREVAERLVVLQEAFLCHLAAFTALKLRARGEIQG